MKHSNPRL